MSACMFLVLGLSPQLTAVFMNFPEPLMGGLAFIVHGMLLAAALAHLEFVDLQSQR